MNVCALGSKYSIKGGKLYADGAFVSAEQGAASAPFVASRRGLGIDTIFAVTDGVLYWDNEGFDGGTARFCIDKDQRVQAVLKGDPPTECDPIMLRPVAGNSSVWRMTVS